MVPHESKTLGSSLEPQCKVIRGGGNDGNIEPMPTEVATTDFGSGNGGTLP
jgi:hypothetical protein